MRHMLPWATIALTLGTSALAKAPVFVTSKPVSDKPAVAPDAALGYVMYRSDIATPLHLMRIPSADDQAIYDGLRATVLEKEKKKYPGRLASYKSALATYQTLKKTDKSAKEPEPPVEPTESSFVFTPFNLMAGTSIGPMNRFAKGDKGYSVYLQSITPGTYRIYGLLSVLPNGAGGTCFCMGSVSFTVKAGEITDLGSILPGGKLRPSGADDTIDPRLKDWTVHPADYRAAGKLPNYFGLALGRIDPIDGVIAYDRDRIIDLAAPGG